MLTEKAILLMVEGHSTSLIYTLERLRELEGVLAKTELTGIVKRQQIKKELSLHASILKQKVKHIEEILEQFDVSKEKLQANLQNLLY